MSSKRAGQRADRPSRSGELVRLITRLLVAQAIAAGAVGLPFSRRHLPSILITLAMAAAVAGLAVFARSGSKGAWLAAVAFETAYFLFGLWKFAVARYVGGTLFALITVGALLHPAVARAYGVRWSRGAAGAEPTLGGAAPEAFGETFGDEKYGGDPVG